MATNKIHSNTSYFIEVQEVETQYGPRLRYVVVNNETGVEEAVEESLPNAINYAEHANSFLVNRLWEWVAAHGVQQRVNMEETVEELSFEVSPDDSLN